MWRHKLAWAMAEPLPANVKFRIYESGRFTDAAPITMKNVNTGRLYLRFAEGVWMKRSKDYPDHYIHVLQPSAVKKLDNAYKRLQSR